MPKISDARRAARRLQILEAAWTCFQRQGLHVTTMDDIISTSGLSAGAVYSYFAGKEALILAAVTTSLGGLRDRLAPLLDADPPPPPELFLQQVATAVTAFTARDGYDLRRIALLGWSEAQRNDELRRVMAQSYDGFRDGLAGVARRWTRLGILAPDADATVIGKTMLAVILGHIVQSAILGDVTPDDVAGGLRALRASRMAP